MRREFGGSVELPVGAPQELVERLIEVVYLKACEETPELMQRRHLNERYQIIRGPVTTDEEGNPLQVWGWYLSFESDKPVSRSVYELTEMLKESEQSFKKLVSSIIDDYNKTH